MGSMQMIKKRMNGTNQDEKKQKSVPKIENAKKIPSKKKKHTPMPNDENRSPDARIPSEAQRTPYTPTTKKITAPSLSIRYGANGSQRPR
jgi:hypothetical protein